MEKFYVSKDLDFRSQINKDAKGLIVELTEGVTKEFERNKEIYDTFNKRITERQIYGPISTTLTKSKDTSFFITESPLPGKNGSLRRIDFIIGYGKTIFLAEIKVIGKSAILRETPKEHKKTIDAWSGSDSGVYSQLKRIKMNNSTLLELSKSVGCVNFALMPILIVHYIQSSTNEDKLLTFGKENMHYISDLHDSVTGTGQGCIDASFSRVVFIKKSSELTNARKVGRLRCTRALGFYAGSPKLDTYTATSD